MKVCHFIFDYFKNSEKILKKIKKGVDKVGKS